jgi:hypothetical protein
MPALIIALTLLWAVLPANADSKPAPIIVTTPGPNDAISPH